MSLDFPTIFDWLEQFAFLRGLPAVYAVLALALLVLLVRDWRPALLSLLVLYLVVGLLFVDVLAARLAFVKVLVGLFVCVMLYWSGRQVPGIGRSGDEKRVRVGPLALSTRLPVRALAAAVWVPFLFLFSTQPWGRLPGVGAEVAYLHFAIYGLAGIGLLTLGLATEPLHAGRGLLLLLLGFDLFYSGLSQAPGVLLTLAALPLLLTIVIAFLAQMRVITLPRSVEQQA